MERPCGRIEKTSQCDMHEKELVLELKAYTYKLHIFGSVWGCENSNRAWEVAHHAHAGGVISDSTKHEYVQKLTSWLLLPAQLDANGEGPARLVIFLLHRSMIWRAAT